MAEEMKSFLQSISGNTALHAVNLVGNPGYNPELQHLAKEIVTRNESRLHVLPMYISKLLGKWIQIQRADSQFNEPNVRSMPSHSHNDFGQSRVSHSALWMDGCDIVSHESDNNGNEVLEFATPNPPYPTTYLTNGSKTNPSKQRQSRDSSYSLDLNER